MTYISSAEHIKDLCRQQILFPILPRSRAARWQRAMFVHASVWHHLSSETSELIGRERQGTLRADLESFVSLPTIGPGFVKLLQPRRDGIYALRSKSGIPEESIRVLGRFVDRDAFIGTSIHRRCDLGEFESCDWREAKRTANAVWRSSMLSYDFLRVSVNGAVSGLIQRSRFRD